MCNCIETINKQVGPDHFLNCILPFRKGEVERPIIGLMRRDTWKLETRRGKVGSVLASYCPFCGEKLGADAEVEAA